jgi:hypothetical protein
MYIKTSDQEIVNLGFRDLQCNNGMHFAGLYETEEERDEIIMGFLSQGDREGDLNLYCIAERTKEEFIHKFTRMYPEQSEHLQDTHRFSLSSPRAFYYPDGVFSPEIMDMTLNAFWEESQKHGKRNIRATAEMVWALENAPGLIKLMTYESRLNYFIPGKSWISICLYNVTKFDGASIMQVLRTHPYTISKGGVITENPYYVEPDSWLRQYVPEYLDHSEHYH